MAAEEAAQQRATERSAAEEFAAEEASANPAQGRLGPIDESADEDCTGVAVAATPDGPGLELRGGADAGQADASMRASDVDGIVASSSYIVAESIVRQPWADTFDSDSASVSDQAEGASNWQDPFWPQPCNDVLKLVEASTTNGVNEVIKTGGCPLPDHAWQEGGSTEGNSYVPHPRHGGQCGMRKAAKRHDRRIRQRQKRLENIDSLATMAAHLMCEVCRLRQLEVAPKIEALTCGRCGNGACCGIRCTTDGCKGFNCDTCSLEDFQENKAYWDRRASCGADDCRA